MAVTGWNDNRERSDLLHSGVLFIKRRFFPKKVKLMTAYIFGPSIVDR